MRALLVALVAFPSLLAGCSSAAGVEPDGAPAPVLETVALHCVGAGGALPSFEGAGSGRCWHHMGHHLYFLPEGRLLHRINGTVAAVEATASDVQDDYAILADVSLDGRSWTEVMRAIYVPTETDRNTIKVEQDVAAVPFRFLRLHMSLSVHEGLAGYLDHSALLLDVTAPVTLLPEPEPRTTLDCRDGVLESFFGEHPCWFGGYDSTTDGAAPDEAHVAPATGSYYDSPSFIHTHYLGLSPGGVLHGEVDTKSWRTWHMAVCAARADSHLATSTLVVTQASHDGRVWADIQRTYSAQPEERLAIDAGVPAGTRFVRFLTEQGMGPAEGVCYHPHRFIVDSRFAIEPVADA